MRSVMVAGVAAILAGGGSAGAVCPRLRADASAYDRSSIAFVGSIVDSGAAPASIDDPVSDDATAATACPVQASWTPRPGEACVIGVVTDGAQRVASTGADTVTIGGVTAAMTPDGCFALCGPRPRAFTLAIAHQALLSHRWVGEDAVTVAVSLRTTTYTTRAQPQLDDGEVRFVKLDRRRARRHAGAARHELWTQLAWHLWLGGAPPERMSFARLRVEHAWKGVCPGDVIAVEAPSAAAPACSDTWMPGMTIAVFGKLGPHGAIVVEGSDAIGPRSIDDLRPAGVTDRDCTP
jgi:hypothetical protein